MGTGAKLFPAFVLPVLGAAELVQRRFMSMLILGLGFFVSVGALALQLFLLGGAAAFTFVTYQERRGVEIEAVLGGLALLGHSLQGIPARVFFDFGSFQVSSPVLDDLAVPNLLFTAVLLATLALGAWLAARRDLIEIGRPASLTVVRYVVATLLVVILTNKVFSPQYLVWLLPFAALLPATRSLLLLAITLLTTLIYPLQFDALVRLDPNAILALNVRNLLLVVYYAWLVLPDIFTSRLQGGDVGQSADEAG